MEARSRHPSSVSIFDRNKEKMLGGKGRWLSGWASPHNVKEQSKSSCSLPSSESCVEVRLSIANSLNWLTRG
jgi:hypothetical protein